MDTREEDEAAVMTYVNEHADNIALSMVSRYGSPEDARQACQRNLLSAHTDEGGRRFWQLVIDKLDARYKRTHGAVGINPHADA